MADQRFIIEMGMGNDMQDMDYQKAAARALADAYCHVTLPLFETTGIDVAQMRVEMTVAVQDPNALDVDALAAPYTRGSVRVRAVFGGQNVVYPETGRTIVVATAAVEAFLPYQGDAWESGTG